MKFTLILLLYFTGSTEPTVHEVWERTSEPACLKNGERLVEAFSSMGTVVKYSCIIAEEG